MLLVQLAGDLVPKVGISESMLAQLRPRDLTLKNGYGLAGFNPNLPASILQTSNPCSQIRSFTISLFHFFTFFIFKTLLIIKW